MKYEVTTKDGCKHVTRDVKPGSASNKAHRAAVELAMAAGWFETTVRGPVQPKACYAAGQITDWECAI